MSVADAKRAVQIGCTGVVVSNHGGRQLDGSRAAFDQLAEIVDAVVDRTAWLPDLQDNPPLSTAATTRLRRSKE
jgi:isopentenyl diphosphate isomerase/L-lactate dehydrogenase-like FMN-dependent dehydrogenase